MDGLIGVDIGGTKCAVVLGEAGEGLRVLDRIYFPTDSSRGPGPVLERIFAAIEELLARNKGIGRPSAVGVSCGGPLDSAAGLILSPPNLPGWDSFPIVRLLGERLSLPVFLMNDANASALVEWRLGAGRGASDLVFLTMGTGLGAGIISGGRLLLGARDLAGEVGHLRLAADGPSGYGKAGSFEGFCSGGGIARAARERARELLAAGAPAAFCRAEAELEGIDARAVVEAARGGDREAAGILAEAGRALGAGLAILMDILNPERIVIGSVFARAEGFLRPSMEAAIEAEALPLARESCRVVAAQTGESIGDLAALMVAAHGAGLSLDAGSGAAPSGLPSRHLDELAARRPELAAARGGVEAAYRTIAAAYERGGKLLVCGNGGSAADSDHVVGELMKGFLLKRPLRPALAAAIRGAGAIVGLDPSALLQGALPAISLTGQGPLATAFANDVAAETVFAQQVLGLGSPGDVLLAISTSGNSRNVVNAAIAAIASGLKVVALTGKGDCLLDRLAEARIEAPGGSTAEIQEGQLPLYHALCAMLEERFFGS